MRENKGEVKMTKNTIAMRWKSTSGKIKIKDNIKKWAEKQGYTTYSSNFSFYVKDGESVIIRISDHAPNAVSSFGEDAQTKLYVQNFENLWQLKKAMAAAITEYENISNNDSELTDEERRRMDAHVDAEVARIQALRAKLMNK